MKLLQRAYIFKEKLSVAYVRFLLWRKLKHLHLYRPNKKKILRLTFIVSIAILSQIVIFKLIKPGVAAAWYHNDWLYRKAVTFSNSGGSLTDKIISISADTSTLISEGKMQSNCADVRFTTAGSSLLEHRINDNTGLSLVATATQKDTTGDDDISLSINVPSGPNQLLAVMIHAQNTGANVEATPITINSITYNGGAMNSRVVNSDEVSNNRRYYTAIYTTTNPASGNNTVSITFNNTSVDYKIINAMVFRGVDQSSPIGVTATSTGQESQTHQLTATGVTAGNYLIGGVTKENGATENEAHNRPAVELPGRQTYYDDTGYNEGRMGAVGGFLLAPTAGSHTMTFSTTLGNGGTNWRGVMAEIKKAPSTTSCNSSTTDFEVHLPAIAAGVNTIYMYYGNPNAPDISADLFDPGKSISKVVDSESISDTSSSTGSVTLNNTASTTENTVLIVLIHAQQNITSAPRDVTDVTYNGVSLYKQAYADHGNGSFSQTSEMWLLPAPSTGSHTVNVTFNQAVDAQVINAAVYKNVKQRKFIHEVDSSIADGTTSISVSASSTIADSLFTAGAMRNWVSTGTISIDSPASSNYEISTGSDVIDLSAAGGYLATGSVGTETISFSLTNPSGSPINAVGAILQPELIYDEFTPSPSAELGLEETDSPLALYLKFDEGVDGSCTGGVKDACDNSNYRNDGEKTGASWQDAQSCASGKCLYFDGSNDVVTVTNADSVDFDKLINDAFTFQAWVRVNSDGENNTGEIVDKGNHFYIRTDSEGADGLADLEVFLDLTTTDPTVNITDGITINRWHHISVSYTDDADDDISVYIDGVLKGTGNGSGAPTGTDSSNLLIGGDSSNNFHGSIDELKIYYFERTALQVKTDYQLLTTPEGSSASFGGNYQYLSDKLIGYWALNESSGNASDSSGNNLTLTNNGTTTFTTGKFSNGSEHVPASSQYFSTATTISGIRTVSFWTNPDSNTNYFLNLTSGANITASSGTLSATGFTNPNFFVNGKASNTLIANEWQLVTVTSDTEINANQFYIGRVGSSYYDGTMDEVRLYKSKLSESDSYSIYSWTPSLSLPAEAAYWKFDEGYGITANDSSDNNNSLTLSAASWTNSGKFSKAWNGTGSAWISRADDSDFDFSTSDDFSVSFWYKSDSTNIPAANEYLLSKGTLTSTGTAGYAFFVNTSGKVVFAIKDDTNWGASSPNSLIPDDAVTSITDINDTSWHHITGTKTNTGRLDIYIDGKLEGSDTSISANGSLANSIALRVGDDDSDTANSLNGNIDDLKIFRDDLASSQIKTLYNQSSSAALGAASTEITGAGSWSSERSYCPPGDTTASCSPVGEWKLDENTGLSSVYDTSGNGYTGGLINVDAADWLPGKLGSGLSLNGTDEYIDIGTGPSAVRTISFWVKPKTTTEYFINLTSTTDYVSASSGTVDMTGDSSETIYVNGIASNNITTDIWQHITVVTSASENASNLDIGRTQDANYLEGIIDEVKIYDYALSASQIAWNFSKGEPIARYRLDECAGTTAYDSGYKAASSISRYDGTIIPGASGNTSAGTCNSGTSTEMWDDGSNGKMNGSLGFDGSNDYIDISDINAIDGASSLSVSAWINTNTLTGGDANLRYIVGKESTTSSTTSFILRLNTATDQIEFYLGGSGYTGITSNAISTNTWYHVTGTWDGTTMKLYLNGKEVASTAKSGSTGSTSEEVKIGSVDLGSGHVRFWSGQIDEVQIFNYGLTNRQVLTEMNDGALHFSPLTGTP